MNTTLNDEDGRAKDVLDRFRGGEGERPRGAMPVTKAEFAAAKGLPEEQCSPPFELGYEELTDRMRQNVDDAYHRMVISAERLRERVEADDERREP